MDSKDLDAIEAAARAATPRATAPTHTNSRSNPMTGIEMIAAERQRQIEVEGWTPEHDDQHTLGELSTAGACYATVGSSMIRGASADEFPAEMVMSEGEWPWEEDWWKPSPDPIRNLVKAGALIAAEIDRLQRKEQPPCC